MSDEIPPAPTGAKCPKCASASVEVAYSTISGRWWIVCQAPGCRHFGPMTP